MSDLALRVDNLGKRYEIGAQRTLRTFREAVMDAVTLPVRKIARQFRGIAVEGGQTLWALRNVSFEVKKGEIVGIIGRNGAGKSTLLKILSRITEPTEGCAELHGRVGSLLEVGTGFHSELTGRENIYLNGAILGMSKAEIARKFDEIVAFSEVEKFLDTQVKHYSSGMYMRLAFAVAAHLETEILLVDEVLAVGDAAFQKKCLGKMGEVSQQGRTVLLVSHNMAVVQSLCTRAVLLHQGVVRFAGGPDDCITEYLKASAGPESEPLASRKDRKGGGKLRFASVRFAGPLVRGCTVPCGSPVSVVLDYVGTAPLRNVEVSIAFYGMAGEGAVFLSNRLTGMHFEEIPEKGSFACSFGKLPLLPGRYTVNVNCEVNSLLADWVGGATQLDVIEGDFYGTGRLPPSSGYGSVAVEHDWSLERPTS